MNEDQNHLRMLSVAHYAFGCIGMVFSFFPILHVVVGWTALTAPEKLGGKGEPLPPFFGWMFLGAGLLAIVLGLTLSISAIISGKKLATREGYWFSFVVACVECMVMPVGTILGVFTIVVLQRDSVKSLYQMGRSGEGSATRSD
jgi:hypothetical protein